MFINTKPLILAKSALTQEQLDVKTKLGCDGIEVQLLNEMIKNRELGLYVSPEDSYNLEKLSEYDIKVIHAPLLPGTGDVTLEVLCDDKDISLLNNIFYIANYIGKKHNRETLIVVHSESYYELLTDLNDSWSRIVRALRGLLDTYPFTALVIENVSPLRGIGKGKELHLSNNFSFDNVTMVQHLIDELHTDRIGTCIDTCHAMLADKYIRALYDAVGDLEHPDLSLEKFFKTNAPYLKLIHLCDYKGSGYGKGKHGIPFSRETYPKLTSILDLYHKYNCKCPITLEVEETDFAVCNGYSATKYLVDTYYLNKKPEEIPESFEEWCTKYAPIVYQDYPLEKKWNFLKDVYLRSDIM